ncbi:MAG: hypothetical protein OQK98_05945 [Gammaproteobacteria bacterium]|nr:hypothetical protein [Gammaproteobacteria bacterium]
MKHNLFTEIQINELKVEVWGKKSNKFNKLRDSFINESETYIQYWQEQREFVLTLAEKKRQILNIKNACNTLKTNLTNAHPSVLMSLALNLNDSIRHGDKYNALDLANEINVNNPGYSISDYDERLWKVLESILDSINISSEDEAKRIKIRTAPRNEYNEELSYSLFPLYFRIFNKRPAASYNSPFYKFIRKTGEFLDIDITRDQVKSGIDRFNSGFESIKSRVNNKKTL